MTIIVCPACGWTRFYITEIYTHVGDLTNDGVLTYDSDGAGGRERIECADCNRECNEDEFARVEFN